MLYKKGQEVLRCQPFAQALKNRYLADYCDFCLQFKLECRLLQCAGCKIVHYCGPNCQKKSWRAYHKEECAYLKKLQFVPQGCVVVVLWHDESVNVNLGFSFSAWCLLAWEHLLAHLHLHKMCQLLKCNVKVQQHSQWIILKVVLLLMMMPSRSKYVFFKAALFPLLLPDKVVIGAFPSWAQQVWHELYYYFQMLL